MKPAFVFFVALFVLSCDKSRTVPAGSLRDLPLRSLIDPPVDIKTFLENASYEKGLGFCVRRFDDKGCNTCTFMGGL